MSFTRQHLNTLQDIVSTDYYSERAITEAVKITNNQEAKILLVNLMNGLFTFEMRMELQHFICDELAKLKQ
jgi:hypothetical protein